MVQGSFAPPLQPGEHIDSLPIDNVQGEAGDWYEVSRYGAITSPALSVYIHLLALIVANLFISLSNRGWPLGYIETSPDRTYRQ